MQTPELVRVVAIDRLPTQLAVTADAAELARVAERLGIIAVESLTCVFALRRIGAVVTGDGVLEAAVVQSCVVSLEPVGQGVSERFTVRFVPAGRETDDDDPEAPDEIPYEGSSIDLGEAAVEQLALALDPYPRRPDAELDPSAMEDEPSGLGVLARLRGA